MAKHKTIFPSVMHKCILFAVAALSFNFCFAKAESDSLWDILALALQNRDSLETEYDYVFTPSVEFPNYLKAKQIVGQLRTGVKEPVLRTEEVENAVNYYNQVSQCKLITDKNRYFLSIATSDKLGHDSISVHTYDGERFFVKAKPGPRWDIVSHPIGNYLLISNLFTKPIMALSPIPQGIEWSSCTIADISRSSEYAKRILKVREGVLLLQAIDKKKIPTSDGDLQQVFEIELATEGQLLIQKIRVFRVPFQGAFDNSDARQKKGTEFEISFSGLPIADDKIKLPFTSIAEVYGNFSVRMGGLTADEQAAVARLLPKFPQDTPILLGTHKVTFNKLDFVSGHPIECFRPPQSDDTVIFNYLTQSFENP